ncbi:MAG: hypothetical protein F6K31_01920 [Symploca sp. SIO2G7]|nr:hypothetical protein [Symploca sp. SIO2G7]
MPCCVRSRFFYCYRIFQQRQRSRFFYCYRIFQQRQAIAQQDITLGYDISDAIALIWGQCW